jgi:hypothetical protein
MPMSSSAPCDVAAQLVFDVVEPSTIALQVAVDQRLHRQSERLSVVLDGVSVNVLEVLADRNRIHLVSVAPGRLGGRVHRPGRAAGHAGAAGGAR